MKDVIYKPSTIFNSILPGKIKGEIVHITEYLDWYMSNENWNYTDMIGATNLLLRDWGKSFFANSFHIIDNIVNRPVGDRYNIKEIKTIVIGCFITNMWSIIHNETNLENAWLEFAKHFFIYRRYNSLKRKDLKILIDVKMNLFNSLQHILNENEIYFLQDMLFKVGEQSINFNPQDQTQWLKKYDSVFNIPEQKIKITYGISLYSVENVINFLGNKLQKHLVNRSKHKKSKPFIQSWDK